MFIVLGFVRGNIDFMFYYFGFMLEIKNIILFY